MSHTVAGASALYCVRQLSAAWLLLLLLLLLQVSMEEGWC
jgi:hypothetical protein